MFPKIGAIQTIILPIVGQVLMGVIIDSFGLFGVRQVPISLIKISGVFILFIGIYIAVVLANRKVANKVSTTGYFIYNWHCDYFNIYFGKRAAFISQGHGHTT